MNPYISRLRAQLAEKEARSGGEAAESILDFLWLYYSASNPVDDGPVRQADAALQPVFEALSFENSNALFDLINDLCVAYQRAAFLEGVRVGFRLFSELEE